MAALHMRSVCLSLFLLVFVLLSGALLSFLAIGRNRADSQGLSLRGRIIGLALGDAVPLSLSNPYRGVTTE